RSAVLPGGGAPADPAGRLVCGGHTGFGDADDRVRNERTYGRKRGQVSGERAQIAVVDTDAFGARVDGAAGLVRLAHLDDGVGASAPRCLEAFVQGGAAEP